MTSGSVWQAWPARAADKTSRWGATINIYLNQSNRIMTTLDADILIVSQLPDNRTGRSLKVDPE